MSTDGVHIPVPSPSSRPLVRDRVSSKSWFIFSWMDERSRNGSHQRTIAISAPSFPRDSRPGGARPGGLSVDLHLDLPRLRLFTLPETDLEDPVPEFGADLFGVHGVGEREGAVEGAVDALHPVVILLLDLLLELPLPPQREDAVVHLDVHLVPRDAGHLRLEDDLRRRLEDVHGGSPRPGPRLLRAVQGGSEGVLQDAVHAPL